MLESRKKEESFYKKGKTVLIKIKDLTKVYGEKKIYNKFSMEIKEECITALLAESGGGKTTLLRIVAGLENYQEGTIEGLLGKKIAFVFQEDRLLPWLTVEQNIAFVLKGCLTEDEIAYKTEDWLKKLQLEEAKHEYPKSLSGGMRRRVALARAFCYPYDLLLLDEPFKGLQRQLKKDILTHLLEQQKKNPKTILWSAHDEEEVKGYVQEIKRIKKGTL